MEEMGVASSKPRTRAIQSFHAAGPLRRPLRSITSTGSILLSTARTVNRGRHSGDRTGPLPYLKMTMYSLPTPLKHAPRAERWQSIAHPSLEISKHSHAATLLRSKDFSDVLRERIRARNERKTRAKYFLATCSASSMPVLRAISDGTQGSFFHSAGVRTIARAWWFFCFIKSSTEGDCNIERRRALSWSSCSNCVTTQLFFTATRGTASNGIGTPRSGAPSQTLGNRCRSRYNFVRRLPNRHLHGPKVIIKSISSRKHIFHLIFRFQFALFLELT